MQRDIRLVTVVTAETTTQGRSLLAWHLFISAMMFCHRAAVATDVPPNLSTVQGCLVVIFARTKKKAKRTVKGVLDVLFFRCPGVVEEVKKVKLFYGTTQGKGAARRASSETIVEYHDKTKIQDVKWVRTFHQPPYEICTSFCLFFQLGKLQDFAQPQTCSTLHRRTIKTNMSSTEETTTPTDVVVEEEAKKPSNLSLEVTISKVKHN